MGRRLPFSRNDYLGYACPDPAKLGTALTVSVEVKLPKLMKDKETTPAIKEKMDRIADQHQIDIDIAACSHCNPADGVFGITNRRKLGRSEIELVEGVVAGVRALIQAEEAQR